MNKTKVLIIGGCGAIGSRLTKKLLDEGSSEIIVIDNLSSSIKLKEQTNLHFEYIDIGNQEKVTSFFKKYSPELIFHMAAHFANQNSVDHPISDVETNIIGLINIFESQRNNPNLKKIIYCSSSCVYGDQAVMQETDPVRPFETPYAINKFVGELYCKYYSELYSIPSAILRIFNSFGPGESPGNYRNVIPNFIDKALKNEDIVITGTGEETRDYCYVDNTVYLLKKLSHSNFHKAEFFNGGSGVETKIIDIANIIIGLTNSKSNIIFQEPRSWDHVKNRKADISLSIKELDYKPTNNLEKQIQQTIDWIKNDNDSKGY